MKFTVFKDVLELNQELLYGVNGNLSETPVIGLKTDGLKQTKLAK
jgi:hypothetical protein